MVEKKERKRRAPSFNPTEMAILLDDVALHKDVLFLSFQTTVSNKTKKDIWERIAMKMAASSSSHRESGKLFVKSGTILPVLPRQEALQSGETGWWAQVVGPALCLHSALTRKRPWQSSEKRPHRVSRGV